MTGKVFLAVVLTIALLFSVVAADTVIVIGNRQFVDEAQRTAQATLEIACQRFNVLRVSANDSHYADWKVIVAEQLVPGIPKHLYNVLEAAQAEKSWVPVLDCDTGKLTQSGLASRPPVAFNDQLPPASAL